MTYNSNKAVSVCVNHQKISGILSVTSDFHRERVITDNTLQKTPCEMVVKIRRVKRIGLSTHDRVNLRGLENFRLDIYTPFHTSSYTNCIWLDFREEITEDNKIIEEISIASLNYTMAS